MQSSWLDLVQRVLRPARPHLDRCLRERERHLAACAILVEERARAITACVRRIERAREAVFAANDGVIPRGMTALEREWRILTRPDPEASLMDLWARIAPPAWIDRKRWRHGERGSSLDLAVALAADADGVEAAEGAVATLREALLPWGARLGPRVTWSTGAGDHAPVAALLAGPLARARHAARPSVLERARGLERAVHDAARARFPERPLFARDLAHAAFVDVVWRAASAPDVPSPVAPLRDLFATGYVLAAIDTKGVTLEMPPVGEESSAA